MAHDMMKAAVFNAPELAPEIQSIPKPTAGPGQVLVRVLASAVNPLDLKIHARQAPHAKQPLPAVLGVDLSGTVEALGEGVHGLKVGDAVFGMTGGVGGIQGSLAEFAAVDADLLAPKPSNLSAREAASLPLAFITAWEGLVDQTKVEAGNSVLVEGASGGVGLMAIQIARAFGGRVVGVHQGSNVELIEKLGATPVDRRAHTTEEITQQHTGGAGFDIVFDTVGGAGLDASFQSVRRGGHVSSCLGWGTHALAPLSFRAATYSGVFTLLPLLTGQGRAHHGEILRAAARLVEEGKVVPHVDPRHFALAGVREAHQAAAHGGSSGKIVVEVG